MVVSAVMNKGDIKAPLSYFLSPIFPSNNLKTIMKINFNFEITKPNGLNFENINEE